MKGQITDYWLAPPSLIYGAFGALDFAAVL
jgi:hypothetical protein